MEKRKKILVLIFVFLIQFINAQNQEMLQAKRLFDKTYYSEVIPLYKKIISKKPSEEAIKNLADSYYYTNKLEKAQQYYRILIENYDGEDLDRNYYFKYAQTLKATNNYAEANEILKKYYSGNSQEYSDFEKATKKLADILAIGDRYRIKNLAINTKNSEFGAVKYKDSLVFAAVKRKPGLFDKIYKWDNETYLKLVSASINKINAGDGTTSYFAKELKTGMHQSNAIFTKDGKTIYFTQNNYKNGRRRKNKEKISTLQIFKAELIKGKWENVTSLPFNNSNYSTEHPALSPDEKTLYFSSDMPGTLGSFDIFSVTINDGVYGDPQNLGALINTDKREQFPFVSKDNKLYFSSDGHLGFGSLDIFVSKIKDGTYTKPRNIGLPLNSNLDDFSFNIDSDTKEGYFASNRAGGKGSDDIYQLNEIKPLVFEDCKQLIAGIITDADTKLPLENAIVVIQQAENKKFLKIITTTNGKFNFKVYCDLRYTISASKENYTDNSKILDLDETKNKSNDASMTLKSLPPDEIKNKSNDVAMTPESLSLNETGDKSNDASVTPESLPSDETKDKSNDASLTLESLSPDETKDKSNDAPVTPESLSPDETGDKSNDDALMTPESLPPDETGDKSNDALMVPESLSPDETGDKSNDALMTPESLFFDETMNESNDVSITPESLKVIKQEEKKLAKEKKQKKALELAALKAKKAEAKAKELAQAKIEKKEKAEAKAKELEQAKIEKKEKAAKLLAERKEKIEKIIAEEKDVVKDKNRLIIKTDPVYFDYDLWYIRKESKVILNRVSELMKKYPDMVVEIGSYTDSRGNAKYNADLSQKRAESTKAYLVKSGINKKRIIAKGYGKLMPIIKCKTGEACTEEQYELNRRSEFVIKKL